MFRNNSVQHPRQSSFRHDQPVSVESNILNLPKQYRLPDTAHAGEEGGSLRCTDSGLESL